MSGFLEPGRVTGRLIGSEIQIFFASSVIMGVGAGTELFGGWHSRRPCGPKSIMLPTFCASIAGFTQHAPYVSISGPTIVSSAASVAENDDCNEPSAFVHNSVFPNHSLVRMVSSGHGPCTIERTNLQLLTELLASA